MQLDRLLDWVWDWTLPVSTRNPVCAFWRGIAIGIVIGGLAVWLP